MLNSRLNDRWRSNESAMIYIILPVHNRIDTTKKFIHSLRSQTYSIYHLILVDDGCIDGTAEHASEEIQNLTILKGNGDLWWAGSLEKARKYLLEQHRVGPDTIILIANDDITFEEDFLSNVVEDMWEFPGSLILPRCYNQQDHTLLDSGVHVNWREFTFSQAKYPADVNVLSTRGLYMKFDVFRDIGGFHPFLLPHYASDYEYTHRAYKKGVKLMISARSAVFLDTQTTGTRRLDFDISFFELVDILFFSKKSVPNCIMWTNFILLACEPKFIPSTLFKKYRMTLGIIIIWIQRRIFIARWHIKVRLQILHRRILKSALKVILGSGWSTQRGWISTDIPLLDITKKRSWSNYFKPNSVTSLVAEHVWEHLSTEDARAASENCFFFLKSGGTLRIAVPDGFCPDPEYIETVKPGGSGLGSNDHKFLYDYRSLSEVFKNAGFSVILIEYWDEHGSFHHHPWKSEDGHIKRSLAHDIRNSGGKPNYTSIILDAKKA